MFCQMYPPISKSVVKLNGQLYRLGSSMICEESTAKGKMDVLASWRDKDKTFILRQQNEYDRSMPPSSSSAKIVHEAGGCAGVWLFGEDTFCKVKGWCEGREVENETIDFVKRCCPTIPVPEVIYSWIDRDWSRTFTVIKRVPGKTLEESWPSLSEAQRSEIAQKIAGYCNELSQLSSFKFQTATKQGVMDYHMNVNAPSSHPSWKPLLLGPFSLKDFTTYLRILSGEITSFLRAIPRENPPPIPLLGNTFHFYHSDLGPTNIMISEEGKVSGVLDWEAAAFYPRFMIALKPQVSAGFYLKPESEEQSLYERWAWGELLQKALIAEGFEYSPDYVKWYQNLVR